MELNGILLYTEPDGSFLGGSDLVGLESLLAKVQEYLPEEKLLLLHKAFQFAEEKHSGQSRLSGEPYIQHPLNIAIYLGGLHLDATTLAAALLHDVIEDCQVTKEELSERFGAEVARLVDGVTKLALMERLNTDPERLDLPELSEYRAASIRKMLVAMAEDIRVVLIKLADRLHNLRTLSAQPQRQRQIIAQETLDIYAPLAHRLGMWDIKWQLEDLAFRYVNQTAYREVSHLLSSGRVARERYVMRQASVLTESLIAQGLKAEVLGRPKNIYSIYQKMQKYREQGKEFDKIFDLYALRVLVGTKADCYNALGVIHNVWHPIPGQFDDYIASVKENLYQSLHTTVICDGGTPLEVQIRTYEMHRIAEYGVAAHWGYKEGKIRDESFEKKLAWLRQLLDWQREVSGAEEFLESVKTDILQDQVFVYTPKGDVRELPAGATPIDLAFKIHTDLGFRCVGSKVNRRLVPLDTALQNGDTVEIVTSKFARNPSLDWLNPALGYLKTASARQSVRQWFRRQEKGANVERGRELLHKALKRMALRVTQDEAFRLLKFDSLEELLASLGSGGLTTAQVEARLAVQEEPQQKDLTFKPKLDGLAKGVQVLGVGHLLTRTAACCNPLPGNSIIGYVTRSRGITVHLTTCPNLRNEEEPERLISVSWGTSQQLYPIRIEVTAMDRVGLLRDVTTLVSAEKVNIASLNTTEKRDGTAVLELTIYTTGMDQLSRVFNKLEGIKGFVNLIRITSP